MAEPFLTPDALAKIKAGGSGDARREQLHDSGISFGGTPEATPYRPRVLYGDETGSRRRFWPRGDAAAARIYRLLEGVAKSASLERAVAGAEYRRLAQEYVELWIYYQTRDKPPPVKGKDHNPFRWMSDGDSERMFMRRVEDICDRSTGVLGSWWAK